MSRKCSLLKLSLLSAILLVSSISYSHAQTLKLIGANSVNGAVTGSILGAAVMGLTDNTSIDALKIGTGIGLIAGIGIAVHDISILPGGQRFYISGSFNDGTNSSILILLDTFYGVVTGTVAGTAAMLISNRPILDGMQYGSSAGAWAGFAFGLADAFIFGKRNEDFISSAIQRGGPIFSFQHKGFRMDLVNGDVISTRRVAGKDLLNVNSAAIQLVSLKMQVR